MKRMSDAWREALALLASNTFAVCVLAAVSAVGVLAFAFGAELEVVSGVLVLGVVTAIIETRMRQRQK